MRRHHTTVRQQRAFQNVACGAENLQQRHFGFKVHKAYQTNVQGWRIIKFCWIQRIPSIVWVRVRAGWRATEAPHSGRHPQSPHSVNLHLFVCFQSLLQRKTLFALNDSRFTFHASSWIWFFTEFSNMSQHMSGDLKRYSAGNTRKVSTNNSLELVRPQLGNKTTDHRTHLNSNSTLNQTDATVATKC